jgi:hypothetical protein
LSVSYNPSIVTSGLILCLDAANPKSYSGTGTAWSDLSGYANNATLVNSPTYLASYKGRFTFNGTNQYASTPLSLGGYTAFTIAAWFRTTTVSKEIAATYGVTNMFELWINANGTVSIYAYGSTTSYRTSTTVVTAGAWTYCVATFNGATPALNMYINGALDNGALTNAIPASINAGSSTVVIGNVNSGSYYFNGSMGQISIYNRAITATEVTQNYNATKGRYVDPVIVTSGLVLNLDAANPQSYAGTGTTWTDLSGNSNNGTLTNGPTFNSANGGSIVVDGIDDYIAVNNSASLDVGGAGNSLTVCYWIYSLVASGYDAHVGKSPGSNTGWIANLNWSLGVGGLPQLRWWLNGTVTVTYNTIKPYLNTWRFIAMSVNKSNNFGYIYEDGVLVASGGVGVVNLSNSAALWIGNDAFGSTANARFANVTFYNRALTSDEVLLNYNALRDRYGL